MEFARGRTEASPIAEGYDRYAQLLARRASVTGGITWMVPSSIPIPQPPVPEKRPSLSPTASFEDRHRRRFVSNSPRRISPDRSAEISNIRAVEPSPVAEGYQRYAQLLARRASTSGIAWMVPSSPITPAPFSTNSAGHGPEGGGNRNADIARPRKTSLPTYLENVYSPSTSYNHASRTRPPSALSNQGRRQSSAHSHSRSRPPSVLANRGRRQSSAHSHRSDHSRFGSDSDVSILSRTSSFDHWQVTPTSDDPDLDIYHGADLTGKVQKLESFPFDCGAVADVYRGEIKFSGQAVAIKIMRRLHTERNGLSHNTRYLYEEANKWHTLSHENVLSFLGICRDIGPSPALILPFCQEGPVMKYLQRNNKTPVEKLDIILGISKGLSYLHSHGLVHGSLATSKILMTDAGVPAIGGYGMSNVLGQIGQTTNMVSSPVRFTAPECFAVEEPAADRQAPGDVYSLSMVMLEIFSGSMPYHDRGSDHAVLLHIVSGGRPDIEAFETVMLPPSLRNIIRRMWNQLPAFRPNIGAVIERLITLKSVGLQGDPAGEQPAELKETEDTYENECKEKIYSSSSGEEASFTDLSELKKTNALDLSGRVRRDGQYPFASGGNSNIYRGKLLRPNGKKIRVAIKMIRLSDDGSGTSEEVIRRLKREASIWSRLVHPNVLPFIGICSDIAPWPVLVSPFYKHGHIQKYLVNHEAADRMAMITAIASGLEYLHSKDVVHGDLKAQNILVDKRGNPSICDFGISKLMGSRGFTTSSVGTAPYMAPELFFVIDAITHNVVLPTTTKSSDVYSFGLLVLEILTGEAPKRRPGRPIINSKEYSGLCPERSDYSTTSVSEKLWETCLMDCWRFEPERRPSMRKIIAGNHFSSSRTIMVSPASVKGRASASTRVSRSEISLPNDSVHPLRRVRKGFWNRRGDHLHTGAGGIGQIVYAPHDRAYPKELKDYPDEKEGYRDEFGICIKWVERAELEESLPKQGKPPIRPYDSFIEYE